MKCLTSDYITYKAQGNELWKSGEEHLLECSNCANKVAEAAQKFVLQQAAEHTTNVRPNKMGHSHPAYIQALISP